MGPDIKIQKIRYGLQANPVHQVAHDPANEQPERNFVLQRFRDQGTAINQHQYQHHHGNQDQDFAVISKHAPGRTGVANIGQIKEPIDDGTGFSQGKTVPNDLLGKLISDSNQQRYQEDGHGVKRMTNDEIPKSEGMSNDEARRHS